jgi:hypothetical protein
VASKFVAPPPTSTGRKERKAQGVGTPPSSLKQTALGRPLDATGASVVDGLLARWLAVAGVSLNALAHPCFLDFCKALAVNYTPAGKPLANSALQLLVCLKSVLHASQARPR